MIAGIAMFVNLSARPKRLNWKVYRILFGKKGGLISKIYTLLKKEGHL
jgi:hypothetical protein